MKILTIIGARPQFIKAGSVSRAIKGERKLEEIIVHTGQHFDHNMSKVFFQELNMDEPKYNLGIDSLSHGAMTGRMMEEIEKIAIKESPDIIMLYGDTNSTLAGALVASKLHIDLAHIEAGLRSFNNLMPEEINRILTDRVSKWLFCPTNLAIENLRNEGYDQMDKQIILSGDVMYDSVLFYQNKLENNQLVDNLALDDNRKSIFCTIHRQENTDDRIKLNEIITALNDLSKQYNIIFPIHPRTQKCIEKQGLNLDFKTLTPIPYLDTLACLKKCDLVVTDSGGLQKEAFFMKTPSVTIRDQTEWVELLEENYTVLSKADKREIKTLVKEGIERKLSFQEPYYGKGNASEIIVGHFI